MYNYVELKMILLRKFSKVLSKNIRTYFFTFFSHNSIPMANVDLGGGEMEENSIDVTVIPSNSEKLCAIQMNGTLTFSFFSPVLKFLC